MTKRLASALADRRGDGGPLVFSNADDLPITRSNGRSWLVAALKAAKLRELEPIVGPSTTCPDVDLSSWCGT